MATLETTTANPSTQQEREERQAAECWLAAHLIHVHGCDREDVDGLDLEGLRVCHTISAHEAVRPVDELSIKELSARIGSGSALVRSWDSL